MIYICGPMTGLPDYNYPAFNTAAADLLAAGYDVQNPADNPKPDPETWEGYMRNAIKQLVECDSVAVLDGWQESKGSRLEVHIATALKMPVRPVSDFLSDAIAEPAINVAVNEIDQAANKVITTQAAIAALAGQP